MTARTTSRPPRVLLLAEMYPPEPRVGAFRARKLARTLRSAGYEVHVLVLRAGELSGGEVEPGILLHLTKPWRSPLQLVRAALTGRSDPGEVPTDEAETLAGAEGKSLASIESEPQGLKRAVVALLKTPDEWQGAIPALVRAAEAIRGPGFDLVYSTAPAISVGLAAYRIAGRWGVPWVMELRDPWRGSGSRRLAETTPLSNWLDRRLYEACVHRAALLVTVADGAADLLREHVGAARAGQVVSILNGIDEIEHDRPPREPGRRLQIVYAGSVYLPRDPAPLVAALARAAESGGPEFDMTFAGVTTPPELVRIRAFTPPALADRTTIRHWLPQVEARALIRGADLVLLPCQKWVRQIPNKLFDYLGARVPILALVEPGSESERMLAAAGGHYIIRTTDSAERADAIARAALEAAATGERQPVGDEAVLAGWTVAEQQARLAAVLRPLVEVQVAATDGATARRRLGVTG